MAKVGRSRYAAGTNTTPAELNMQTPTLHSGGHPAGLPRLARLQLLSLTAGVLALGWTAALASASDPLATGFVHPPASAKPWVYWFWLDGNITSNGITADLEAMQRTGVGGVLIMEVDQGAPRGAAAFGGPLWRELFKHVCAEASRLGLEVNMNNDAGWCGSGGPWITPELAMQKIVWTETEVSGPKHFEAALPQPQAVASYYHDIAVFAFPTPAPYKIPHIQGKSALVKQEFTPQADYPVLAADKTIPRDRIVNLTASFGQDGRLSWDVPPGKWTVLRLGHTPTGANNAPSPLAGRGLECDKLSTAAAEAQFAGLMAKLIADSKPLVPKTLVSTHIDSWEVGSQNWTPRFREEFQRLRGYDPLPLLPVITGRVVDSLEVSERFLWDIRQTVSDMLIENYAGHFRTLARQQGLRLSIEAYDGVPCDELSYGGRADEPMAEFWSWSRFGAAYSCTEMASAAHVYGKPILGAEAFTATDAEKWLGHPGNIKDIGDWAFCEGINRFVFHRYALQPWPNRPPGMSMGPWGLHYERTSTWWEQSAAWHEYLARCQYLLQQGLFVADLCFLAPERAPSRFQIPTASIERPAYNYDACSPEVVLTRMKVKDGRLVLPDGMSYRLLVLPQVETMTPQLLRQIRSLVKAGATVVGPPPLKSPSLADYPHCDAEVQTLANELWGAPATLAASDLPWREHAFGKGRVLWGGSLARKQDPSAYTTSSRLSAAKWIWFPEGNPALSAPVGKRFFRRLLTLNNDSRTQSAQLVITADNAFECWVNGRRAGSGENFGQTYTFNVARSLQPGTNLIAVAAVNSTDNPNPAGLIATLAIRFADGHSLEIVTDHQWDSALTAPSRWTTDPAAAPGWTPALELGPLGMAPWGDIEQNLTSPDLYPQITALGDLLAKLNVTPDFTAQSHPAPQAIRYIHRVLGGTDFYFLANKNPQAVDALCSFRVTGRRPELWWPETGRLEQPAVYDQSGAGTRLPIHFDPAGSVFVLFREKNRPERDRITSVARDGQLLLDTAASRTLAVPLDNNAALTNTFSFAVWANPAADTALLPETNNGISGFDTRRNDALFPPPGHEVYGDDAHAGAGLAVGHNGVCVFEHGADYFAPVLVCPVSITNWTHLAVVYQAGQPSLYVNGRLARTGLKSVFTVHPGVGVQHGRGVERFRGDLSEFELVNRALNAGEVEQLMKRMPRAGVGLEGLTFDLTRSREGAVRALAFEPGTYTLAAANGRRQTLTVGPLPRPIEITGPWDVRFAPGWGAPEHIALDKLVSWTDHTDPGVKYFSGHATYATTFRAPHELLAGNRRVFLDLGRVEVMAEVRLNGQPLGVLWKAPYRLEITSILRAGDNTLEVKVVNLWVNRQIGDEQLPEDSERNPSGTLKAWPRWLEEGKPSPTGRFTFTSWRLWHKNDPLQPSGLIGPVVLRAAEIATVPPLAGK
jgi:hypothetical protein